MDSTKEEAAMPIDAPSLEGADWFLQNIVQLAKEGPEIPVTLTVHGAQISGFVCSGQRYSDLIADLFASSDNPVHQKMGKWVDGFGEDFSRDSADGDGPYFIHLHNAFYITAAGAVPVARDLIWRGKLSDVSGFSFGVIGPDN